MHLPISRYICQGGATPIIPSRAVAAHLRQTHPGVAERLAAEGVLTLTLT